MPSWERTDVAQLRLHVPSPPSTNHLFATVTRPGESPFRVRGKKYRAWLKEAGWEVKRQAQGAHLTRSVAVLIEIDLPARRDLDNAIKALLDLLVSVHVLQDDSLVDDLRIVRRGDKTHAAVSIWLI